VRGCTFLLESRKERADAYQTYDHGSPSGNGRAMFYVLIAPLTLAVIAGLALGLGWISLPWS
jgi:hypothetical protein